MKVLWFSPTPSLYKNEKSLYNGGGWIGSLEEMIKENTEIELGICFFHKVDTAKSQKASVTYYPVKSKKEKIPRLLINKVLSRIEPINYKREFLKVVDDFRPDVIHIWGTESYFAQIQRHVKVPVILYLQGVINGCEVAYYPPGISKYQFLFSPIYFKNNIFRKGPVFVKRHFGKQSKIEAGYFRDAQYIIGRTDWDKSISTILAPQARYFHVDEILRASFYNKEDQGYRQQNKITIVSTLSASVYKGIDMVLKTAKLLKEHTTVSFEWCVAGVGVSDKIVLFYEKQLKISGKDYNVNFIGIKDNFELTELLEGANIYVHPSYIDNSPNSLCEAQMLGIPVIASNVGGISTLIENNVTGMLVPANAPFEMANKIVQLAADDKLALSLGRQGKLAAMKRHNREKILADMVKVYKTLCNK